MSISKTVRLGVIGVGSMGAAHARMVRGGAVPGMSLGALACGRHARDAEFSGVPVFDEPNAMMRSGLIDAVLIATPHYQHTPLGIAALEAGLHLLLEKPVSVHKADCERIFAAHRDKRLVFAAMFNQRTDPKYIKLRELVQSGELGNIHRILWTITDWFRTDAYYATGGWRATWAGEGGGVLLNQCPHQLDLWQWIFGMPSRVRAHCGFGRFHDIEVEDDVTAFMEYAEGTQGVFITTTGEAPGVNRLEVAAENGLVTVEGNTIRWQRNKVAVSEFRKKSSEPFGKPATETIEFVFPDTGAQHAGILANFANAIRFGEPPIAPAEEGVHSVELANAMILSGHCGETLGLPLDANAYPVFLESNKG